MVLPVVLLLISLDGDDEAREGVRGQGEEEEQSNQDNVDTGNHITV